MDDTENILGEEGTPLVGNGLANVRNAIDRTERSVGSLQSRLRSLPRDCEEAKAVSAELAALNRMLQNLYEERGERELAGEEEGGEDKESEETY